MEYKNAKTGATYDPYQGVRTDELVTKAETPEGDFLCPYCERYFATAEALRAHLDGE